MSAWPNLGGMKVVSTALFGGPVDGVVEFPQPSALVVGSVVAENAHVVLLHFDVPTGLEMAVSFSSRRGEAGEGQDLLVRLPHQCRPVLNRPREVANMDQIERVLLPCPFGFCIVDLELDIWGDPGGLDWAQVCSDDLGGGIVPVAANQSTATRIRSRGGGSWTHSATSIAQMPVPVPMSRILCGFLPMGARTSLPPWTRTQMWWIMSRLVWVSSGLRAGSGGRMRYRFCSF